MTNEELTERFLKLQAQLLATQVAVRYLMTQHPALATFLRENAHRLGEVLMPVSATDSQIEEAEQTLALLATAP